jgi:exosortase
MSAPTTSRNDPDPNTVTPAQSDDTPRDVAPPTHREISRGTAVRSAGFGVLVALMLAAFWTPLTMLMRFSFQQEHYSHIILIPLTTAAIFVLHRKEIFARVQTDRLAGLGFLGAGVLFYLLGQRRSASLSINDQLSAEVFAVLVVLVGAFILCYGLRTTRSALFPVLFLFLTVPIPDLLLNQAIVWLQTGSAEVSHAMFEVLGVPVFRNGFVFTLPGVTIEVARECSGIRSSMALLIMMLLSGHFFLTSPWTRAALLLAAFPLLVVKNGIRIVTLSLLTIYVDPGFLTGELHRQGGIVFFLIALLILGLVVVVLQRSEQRWAARPGLATPVSDLARPRS